MKCRIKVWFEIFILQAIRSSVDRFVVFIGNIWLIYILASLALSNILKWSNYIIFHNIWIQISVFWRRHFRTIYVRSCYFLFYFARWRIFIFCTTWQRIFLCKFFSHFSRYIFFTLLVSANVQWIIFATLQIFKRVSSLLSFFHDVSSAI